MTVFVRCAVAVGLCVPLQGSGSKDHASDFRRAPVEHAISASLDSSNIASFAVAELRILLSNRDESEAIVLEYLPHLIALMRRERLDYRTLLPLVSAANVDPIQTTKYVSQIYYFGQPGSADALVTAYLDSLSYSLVSPRWIHEIAAATQAAASGQVKAAVSRIDRQTTQIPNSRIVDLSAILAADAARLGSSEWKRYADRAFVGGDGVMSGLAFAHLQSIAHYLGKRKQIADLREFANRFQHPAQRELILATGAGAASDVEVMQLAIQLNAARGRAAHETASEIAMIANQARMNALAVTAYSGVPRDRVLAADVRFIVTTAITAKNRSLLKTAEDLVGVIPIDASHARANSRVEIAKGLAALEGTASAVNYLKALSDPFARFVGYVTLGVEPYPLLNGTVARSP